MLERDLERRDRFGKLVVASSMSIYGEGQYGNAADGETVAPGLRPESSWPGASGSCSPTAARRSRPSRPRDEAAAPDLGLRGHEARPRGALPRLGAAYGIPTVALRFFNVFGARQALSNPYTGVAAIFASRLLNDRPPRVFEDGLQTRDFIHVRTSSRGCRRARAVGADGEASTSAPAGPTSVLDVANALARGLGKEIEPELPGEYRAGDVRHCFADPAARASELGFETEIEFEDGMRELVEWLEGQEASDGVDAAYEALAERGLAR